MKLDTSALLELVMARENPVDMKNGLHAILAEVRRLEAEIRRLESLCRKVAEEEDAYSDAVRRGEIIAYRHSKLLVQGTESKEAAIAAIAFALRESEDQGK